MNKQVARVIIIVVGSVIVTSVTDTWRQPCSREVTRWSPAVTTEQSRSGTWRTCDLHWPPSAQTQRSIGKMHMHHLLNTCHLPPPVSGSSTPYKGFTILTRILNWSVVQDHQLRWRVRVVKGAAVRYVYSICMGTSYPENKKMSPELSKQLKRFEHSLEFTLETYNFPTLT